MAYRDLVTCVYVSDDAKSYLKRMDLRYQGQNNGADPPVPLLGAVPATLTEIETLPNTPGDLKPRTLLVRTADGTFVGRVPCFTAERYAAMTNSTAITFYDGQGVSHAGQVYGHEGERSNHKSNLTGRP